VFFFCANMNLLIFVHASVKSALVSIDRKQETNDG